MRIPQLLMFALALTVLGACGGDATKSASSTNDAPEEDAHAHDKGLHDGAVIVTSDHSAHFEVVHDVAARRIDLYVMDADMKPVAPAAAPVLNLLGEGGSASVKGQGAADHWTFVHERLGGEPEGRFRIRIGDRTYVPPLEHLHGAHEGHEGHDDDEHAGHDHDEGCSHGPHDGVVAAFTDDPLVNAGWLELKLHDDLGDLELWLAKDEGITKPFDLPANATVTVLFHDKDARKVTLAVRNRERNEDEDGVANLRKTGTNYFIYPGKTGADAKWLCGADFAARVTVSFEHNGAAYTTKVFELRPHTHGAHDQSHDEHAGDDHDGPEHDKGDDDHDGHDHDGK